MQIRIIKTEEENDAALACIEALMEMEQQGLKQKDLVPFMGSKSKVSEVLAGKRMLSLNMIRKLHEGLGMPLEVLLGPGEVALGMVAEDQPKYLHGGRCR